MPQTPVEWLFCIAALASIWSAITGTPKWFVRMVEGEKRSSGPNVWFTGVMLALTWLGLGGLIYMHYFAASGRIVAERLSSQNARLQVINIVPVFDDNDDGMHLNVFSLNKGSSTAFSEVRYGLNAVSNGLIPEKDVASFFSSLRTTLSFLPITTNEAIPNDDATSFEVPSEPGVFLPTKTEWNSGKLIYLFIMLRYTDHTVPAGKWIYTEVCTYFVKGVRNACETGHNWAYILPEIIISDP